MIVLTNSCPMCGTGGAVVVDEQAYVAWRDNGVLMQDAMPDLTVDERELLISGTHAHCWEKMWAEFKESKDA
jgi:hypothetical protein